MKRMLSDFATQPGPHRDEARDLLEQLNAPKPRYARRAKAAKKGARK